MKKVEITKEDLAFAELLKVGAKHEVCGKQLKELIEKDEADKVARCLSFYGDRLLKKMPKPQATLLAKIGEGEYAFHFAKKLYLKARKISDRLGKACRMCGDTGIMLIGWGGGEGCGALGDKAVQE